MVEKCYRNKVITAEGHVVTTHTSWRGRRVFLPDDGVFEAQLGRGLLDLLLEPGLGADQVLDELRHPPDGRVAVETLQTRGQVFGDGQRQVLGPRVQTVHYGQLHNLDVFVIGFSCRNNKYYKLYCKFTRT